MRRRHLLLALCCPPAINAQNLDLPRASPVDAVGFYIIPTDNVSEQATGNIARVPTQETGLWIKSTLWTPTESALQKACSPHER